MEVLHVATGFAIKAVLREYIRLPAKRAWDFGTNALAVDEASAIDIIAKKSI